MHNNDTTTESFSTFENWTRDRSPVHLSTNTGSNLAAFQSWRNFKEAFAPELVAQAVEETTSSLGRPVQSSIDPFGGSGTTALASQFMGIHPTTIEVNPYLADLIEAKLCSYDAEQLIRDYTSVIESDMNQVETPFPGAPATFVEPGVKEKFLFSSTAAQEIASLTHSIDALSNEENRRLLKVLLASISVELSNVVVSGKGRRYKRNWQSNIYEAGQAKKTFARSFERAIYDIQKFSNRKQKRYRLIRGDSRRVIPSDSSYDIAVFSPPYPNSFDYTDVYNVELWVGGYLRNSDDNRSLRFSTLRSHVQLKRSYATEHFASNILNRVMYELEAVRNELWNKTIPDMVFAYFDDMRLILNSLKHSLNQGGRCYAVVGDSQYKSVRIPVADILVELAETLGYKYVHAEPFRSMRASPQQGGSAELVETMIVLERT